MKEQLREFISNTPLPDVDSKDLKELLYSLSENRLFVDDVDTVSLEQAILCWQIIETLKSKKLPDELVM